MKFIGIVFIFILSLIFQVSLLLDLNNFLSFCNGVLASVLATLIYNMLKEDGESIDQTAYSQGKIRQTIINLKKNIIRQFGVSSGNIDQEIKCEGKE